ncbi:MAG: peptidylprolyl isomerase, partial [Flavobacteriales bacterium]
MKKAQMRLSNSTFFTATLLTAVALLFMSASGCDSAATSQAAPTAPVKVQIDTRFGPMVVQLSDSTPQHRDNFVKLVEEGFYD